MVHPEPSGSVLFYLTPVPPPSGRMMELEDLWMVHPEPSGSASVLFGSDQPAAARFIPMAPVGGLAVADDSAASADSGTLRGWVKQCQKSGFMI